jgi:hypothetical protein
VQVALVTRLLALTWLLASPETSLGFGLARSLEGA